MIRLSAPPDDPFMALLVLTLVELGSSPLYRETRDMSPLTWRSDGGRRWGLEIDRYWRRDWH